LLRSNIPSDLHLHRLEFVYLNTLVLKKITPSAMQLTLKFKPYRPWELGLSISEIRYYNDAQQQIL
jgi:aspartyl/asparaginyl beta-hydroxylase (cupin superfamily)